MRIEQIAKLPTPETDKIRVTPIMADSVTQWKWDRMTEHARSLEQCLAAAIFTLEHSKRNAFPWREINETLDSIKELRK